MATDAAGSDARKQSPQSRGGEQRSGAQTDGMTSTARLPSRHNKLYRTPPTPDIQTQLQREKSFILDAVAVASISEDFARSNPKYGSVLPTYNAQRDWHSRRYFDFPGVRDTLDKNMQSEPGTSIEGVKQDWFNSAGHRFRYLSSRNERQGNGYSNEARMGHGCLWEPSNPRALQYERKPLEFQGYNGRFGYRRTTPSLRQRPSTFGVNTRSDIY